MSTEVCRCFLCGRAGASLPSGDYIGEYFTDMVRARSPQSSVLCDYCAWVIKLRAWYYNESRGKWVKLFARGWSSLFVNGAMVAPTIGAERTEGGTTLPTVSDLPTRAQMRGWLLEPPEPPFTIVIAQSGQKHILPWAQEGYDRDYFPVQFELDCVWVNRVQFATLIGHYEALMALGFSKTEIDSGNYHSDRLMRAILQYGPHEAIIEPYRGGRLLALCSHVAQLDTVQPQHRACAKITI